MNMMKIVRSVAMAAVFGALYAGTAQADDGFFQLRPYVGVGGGMTKSDLKDYNFGGGVSVSGGSVAADSHYYVAPHVGLELNKYLAIEASYLNSSKEGRDATLATFAGAKTESQYKGWAIDAIGSLPICTNDCQSERFSLLGTVGVADIRMKTEVTGSGALAGFNTTVKDSSTAWRVGAGAKYQLTDNVSARALVRYTDNLGQYVDNATSAELGISYRF